MYQADEARTDRFAYRVPQDRLDVQAHLTGTPFGVENADHETRHPFRPWHRSTLGPVTCAFVVHRAEDPQSLAPPAPFASCQPVVRPQAPAIAEGQLSAHLVGVDRAPDHQIHERAQKLRVVNKHMEVHTRRAAQERADPVAHRQHRAALQVHHRHWDGGPGGDQLGRAIAGGLEPGHRDQDRKPAIDGPRAHELSGHRWLALSWRSHLYR
jgi:hypothetical protein